MRQLSDLSDLEHLFIVHSLNSEVIIVSEKELEELEQIRKLIMLLLVKFGATQEEVASALGVTRGRVSQMLSTQGIATAKVECTH